MSRFSIRGTRWRRWLPAIVVLLGLAGSAGPRAIAAGGAAPRGGAVARTVVVPRLGGSVLAAYQRLHARGLRVNIPRGLSFDSAAPAMIARAVPKAGRRVAPGSAVTLYLRPGAHRAELASARAPRYRIPRFVGGPVSRAYTWITSRRLAFRAALGALKGGGASTLLANYRVTAQRPAAGRKLALVSSRGGGHGRRAGLRVSPLSVRGAQPKPRPKAPAHPLAPPLAQTGAATVAGQTSATLNGVVNPEGRATTYYFIYGPTTAYGSRSPAQSAGSGSSNAAVTSTLSGLAAASTVHYRLVAISSAGTSYGADQTFTTSGAYQNPVFSAAAFPDPFVLDNGDGHADYWAFGTGDLFPVLHSADLVHWTAAGTAMTARPAWAVTSGDWHPWAPSVVQSSAPCPGAASGGCYVMYYVGLSEQLKVNCIGVATASSPGGPYTDQGPLDLSDSSGPSTTPLGCGDANGQGNIDPSPFIDSSGQPYLYVSSDFACTGGTCSLQPTISVIPLTADFLHASGGRMALFSGDRGTWEQAGLGTATVEGPMVELHNGTYYLFYSGGSWRGQYAMGYATSTSPVGPFTKSPSNPILSGTPTALSPGGGDRLVTGPQGGLWMVYAGRGTSYSDPRTLRLDPFAWQPAPSPGAPDVPVIQGPSSTPQGQQP